MRSQLITMRRYALVHQENEEEKIIHYNHSMQWIMLDMVRYVQVID